MTTTTTTTDVDRGAVGTRRRRRRPWPWVAGTAVAVVGLTAAAAVAHHRSSAAGAVAAAVVANGGSIITVDRGTVERTIESPGTVVSNLDVDIKCRASGEITKLPFERSQRIKKGDLLCQLDPTDEDLAVESAELDVELSTAKLEQARQTYDIAKLNLATTRERVEAAAASAKVKAANLQAKAGRQRELIAQQLGSKEDYETAQTDAAAAAADARAADVSVEELTQQALQLDYKDKDVRAADIQLRKDRTALANARRQKGYTTVLSPVDGVVATVSVPLGYQVQSGTGGFSGGTTIMTVSDLSRVFVLASVDQSDISGVRKDQPARIKVDSFPDRTFAGVVVRKSPVGVTTSNVTTFEVKVEVLDAHKDLLAPQMTGTVTVVEAGRADVLKVPAAAVSRESGGKAFVTMAADGRRRDVSLGLSGTDAVEVTGGLAAGDKVVVGAEELPTRWKSGEDHP